MHYPSVTLISTDDRVDELKGLFENALKDLYKRNAAVTLDQLARDLKNIRKEMRYVTQIEGEKVNFEADTIDYFSEGLKNSFQNIEMEYDVT